MIVLDYRLAPPWNRRLPDADLSGATESSLRYDYFLGDVIIRVDGGDLSAAWGWVPILDFALALRSIMEALEDGTTELFEFTESEAVLRFTRSGDVVRIEASYTPVVVQISFDMLYREVVKFCRRILDELAAAHPDLRSNPFYAEELKRHGLRSSSSST
jgi:hypothetical protein